MRLKSALFVVCAALTGFRPAPGSDTTAALRELGRRSGAVEACIVGSVSDLDKACASVLGSPVTELQFLIRVVTVVPSGGKFSDLPGPLQMVVGSTGASPLVDAVRDALLSGADNVPAFLALREKHGFNVLDAAAIVVGTTGLATLIDHEYSESGSQYRRTWMYRLERGLAAESRASRSKVEFWIDFVAAGAVTDVSMQRLVELAPGSADQLLRKMKEETDPKIKRRLLVVLGKVLARTGDPRRAAFASNPDMDSSVRAELGLSLATFPNGMYDPRASRGFVFHRWKYMVDGDGNLVDRRQP